MTALAIGSVKASGPAHRCALEGEMMNDGEGRTSNRRPGHSLAWFVVLVSISSPARPIDLEAWARESHTFGDWVAVQFRDPYSGRFLASRAGTEDAARRATLTLTLSPSEDCRTDVIFVFERRSPHRTGTERRIRLQLQIDHRQTQSIGATLVRERGDRFEFAQLDAEFDPTSLSKHTTLRLRSPPELNARFSLKGMTEALDHALRVCEDFRSPDDGIPDFESPSIDIDERIDL